MKASAILYSVGILLAATGIIWLSVSLFQLLLGVVSAPVAAGLVGLGFLFAPAAVILIFIATMSRKIPARALVPDDAQAQLMTLVTQSAEKLAQSSPFTAMALAVTGGVLSVHVPSSVTPILLRIAENADFTASAPAN